MDSRRVLFIEPYYGGSHRAFADGLIEHVPGDFELLTLPARKWKWRMRGSAMHFANELAEASGTSRSGQSPAAPTPPNLIFCSSFLSLSDFKSLAPEPYRLVPSIAYFHENQFAYPLRAEHERDYHFGLTNITTALAADVACFNSRFNLDSFLDALPGFIAKMPDYRPVDLPAKILAKARVIAPPFDGEAIDRALANAVQREPGGPLHIVWNHRWEHDKNPDDFFSAVFALADAGEKFKLSVVGETFDDAPPIFEKARDRLAGHIEHFGYQPHRDDYARILADADVVVSTAQNEFFGLSVLEACYAGCYPVLPGRLAYPGLFGHGFLYDSQRGLVERLRALAASPPSRNVARATAEQYSWKRMAPAYDALLGETVAAR